MTDDEMQGHGVILNYLHEPLITGYLILGGKQYEIWGRRVSKIRAELQFREIVEEQKDLFDERGPPRESECNQL